MSSTSTFESDPGINLRSTRPSKWPTKTVLPSTSSTPGLFLGDRALGRWSGISFRAGPGIPRRVRKWWAGLAGGRSHESAFVPLPRSDTRAVQVATPTPAVALRIARDWCPPARSSEHPLRIRRACGAMPSWVGTCVQGGGLLMPPRHLDGRLSATIQLTNIASELRLDSGNERIVAHAHYVWPSSCKTRRDELSRGRDGGRKQDSRIDQFTA